MQLSFALLSSACSALLAYTHRNPKYRPVHQHRLQMYRNDKASHKTDISVLLFDPHLNR